MGRIDFAPRRLLDVGCGSGNIYQTLAEPPERFVGLDFAPGMCALHPKGQGVFIAEMDFNDTGALASLGQHGPFDLVVSSCALQWAADLPKTLRALGRLGDRFALAILTDQTLAQLHQRSGLSSPLLPQSGIEEAIKSTLGLEVELRSYEIDFESPAALLGYVRQSGITGGSHRGLGYSQVRALMQDRSLTTLTFEAVMAWGARSSIR